MIDLDPENVGGYLQRQRWISAAASVRVVPLAGGVSNTVMRISPSDGDDFVIKQSQKKLRTKVAWFSQRERIFREADMMAVLAGILPAGGVPLVLFEDRANYILVMEAVDAEHTVWKEMLLTGTIDSRVAATAAEFLATVHRRTGNQADLAKRFGDRTIFHELRVDPFYRSLVAARPSLREPIQRLMDEMAESSLSLVLADFSPKNILVTKTGITLVDFETGHFGDPAFDLGFFLSHLLLKAVFFGRHCRSILDLADLFWRRYIEGLRVRDEIRHESSANESDGPAGSDRCVVEIFGGESGLSRRTVEHLAGCLLARIDGKSPVDYLQNESQRNTVRDLGESLFRDRIAHPGTAFDRFAERLL
ncbi:MAG: phosphotransferase [Planctomycetes bacterium]|nr:phosphotransferase [Planctomycetota bacterium]